MKQTNLGSVPSGPKPSGLLQNPPHGKNGNASGIGTKLPYPK